MMRNTMSGKNMFLGFMLLTVFVKISVCQETKTCDPVIESCGGTTADSAPTKIPTVAATIAASAYTKTKTTVAAAKPASTKNPIIAASLIAATTKTKTTVATTTTEKKTTATSTTTKTTTTGATTTKATTTTTTSKKENKVFGFKKANDTAESPYDGGYDKFTVFAECCWELRLMYYWECDLWLKKCCYDPNVTDYRPVCSSTGPGYIRWWKPYRRVFYNECAATKYLCDSLPPLTLPWKCMWRRNFDHPHCQGSDEDVIRELAPPKMDCTRYLLAKHGIVDNKYTENVHYYIHEHNEDMPDWRKPYPQITLNRCGKKLERPKEPEPLIPYPPTTAPPLPTPEKLDLQELKRSDSVKNDKTTAYPTSSPPTVSFPDGVGPPAMDLRTPYYGMSLWSVLLGVFTMLFIVGTFIFSLWIGKVVGPPPTS